jgi:hypothetical protein
MQEVIQEKELNYYNFYINSLNICILIRSIRAGYMTICMFGDGQQILGLRDLEISIMNL